MTTSLQDLIQWTIENAFNIEGQDGTKYVAIDHEELRQHFDKWLQKEKEIIIKAYKTGYFESMHLDFYPDKHSKEYYDQILRGDYDEPTDLIDSKTLK